MVLRLVQPEASAESAGLRYAGDDGPGITRRRAGRGFSYRRPDGTLIRDARTLDRIRSLAIPPAWTDVWIATRSNGHLQATGRDARGRKQYRYHPAWRAARDEAKYGRMLAFGGALKAIRRQVESDLRKRSLSRDHVVAIVVRLLERTLIRVGNEEYARSNRSYGLTTLLHRHVSVEGSKIRFKFRAKSGVQQAIGMTDMALARAVARCQELPGQTLFKYLDDDGEYQAVDSGDVNAYLRRAAGRAFSAKDVRTWAGTVLAATTLAALDEADTMAARKRSIVRAVDAVAERLGNTRAVCRRSYIHPAVLDAYLDGETVDLPKADLARADRPGRPLPADSEAAVLALLRRRLSAGDAARAA
jgi:DNA topoisomerase-1